MRMSTLPVILLLAMLFNINLNAKSIPNSAIDFYNGTLEEAQQKASDEGKLFFVDFYAKWCAPCKWMDETTFTDTKVSSMLNQNYVSLKVDIDEFDGFSLKQKYKVKYLPTILIFNSKGELIERLEETMSPRKLMTVLNQHHNSNGSNKIVKQMNSSPKAQEEVAPIKERNYDDIIPNRTGKYRVQVGIYSDFKNTFKYVNELKQTFAEPIVVLNDYNDGKIVYKIMIGEFKQQNLANDFARILKDEFGINGMVK